MCNTPATQAGVYEYTATLNAWALSFCPSKLGASALMIIDRMKTPTIAITKVDTAPAPGPDATGRRYVPMNGNVRPISDPPTNPATAPIATRGAT